MLPRWPSPIPVAPAGGEPDTKIPVELAAHCSRPAVCARKLPSRVVRRGRASSTQGDLEFLVEDQSLCWPCIFPLLLLQVRIHPLAMRYKRENGTKGHPVRERNGSSSGVMLSSRFNSDSCCPLSVRASILTKVMSSGASRPQLRLPEELLAPAESKGPGSP